MWRCAQGSSVSAWRLWLLASRRPRPAAVAQPAQIPGCAKASLDLVKDGQLSLATDNPAFRPWWGGALEERPWEITNPRAARATSRRSHTQSRSSSASRRVRSTWQAVPFRKSFRPGKKPFDFYMAQVSNKPRARRAVTSATSYYCVNQAVVGAEVGRDLEGPIARRPQAIPARRAARDDELRLHRRAHPARLRPAGLHCVNDAVHALKNGQIDGMVDDFPSMVYVTEVQVAGRRRSSAGSRPRERERFGMVFQTG